MMRRIALVLIASMFVAYGVMASPLVWPDTGGGAAGSASSRTLFTAWSAPGAATVVGTTFVPLPWVLTETTPIDDDINIGTNGLACNTTSASISSEFHAHIGLNTLAGGGGVDLYEIAAGRCIGDTCTLVPADAVTESGIVISANRDIGYGLYSMTFSGDLPADGCIGLMVRSDSAGADNINVDSGTMNVFVGGGGGSTPGGLSAVFDDKAPVLGGELLLLGENFRKPYYFMEDPGITGDTLAQSGTFRQELDIGPFFICADGNSNYPSNTCNSNDDCVTGACVFNDNMDTVEFIFAAQGGGSGAISGGGPGTGPTGNEWFAFDPVRRSCMNAQNDCRTLRPMNPLYPVLLEQWEFDYRPGLSSNILGRYEERFRVVVEPGDSQTNQVRSTFKQVEVYPWQGKANFGTNVNHGEQAGFLRHETSATQALETRKQTVHIMQLGHKDTIHPGFVSGPSTGAPGVQGFHTGNTNLWGGTFPGMMTDGLPLAHMRSNIISEFGLQQSQSANVGIGSTINVGLNPYGACDGAGVEAEGVRCISNENCNDQAFYEPGVADGICVKGNNADSSGTADGVCITDLNAATRNVEGLCDVIGAQCGGAGSECVETQLFYTSEFSSVVVSQSTLDYNDGDLAGVDTTIVWGYCSSTGTGEFGLSGSPKSEGVPCIKDNLCDSGICVKDYQQGGRLVNSVTVNSINAEISGTAKDGNRNSEGVSGDFDKGDLSINNLNLNSFKLKMSGTGKDVNNVKYLNFNSPSFSSTGVVTQPFNGAVIYMSQMWSAAASSRLPYFRIRNGFNTNAANQYVWQQDAFGWDSGLHKLGNVRLWSANEGTTPQAAANLQIKFDTNPGASGQGFAVLHSSGVNDWGPLFWGSTVGANADGNAVCVEHGLDCVVAGNTINGATSDGCTGTGLSGYFAALCR